VKVTVLVPTYRRPADLARCLKAIQQQERPADEVLIIVRDTDTETWDFFETLSINFISLRIEKVSVSGQVAALNAGLDIAQGDIIAITDDDAEPHPDWLTRIECHFLSNKRLAGVGGRDRVFCDGELDDGKSNIVGRVQWFGRVIGNHHIGEGSVQEVEILKGANMSYRASAIANLRFDQRLRGSGAQVHNDLAFSLKVRKAGWLLIYDPEVTVNHYPAKRFDEDKRSTFNKTAFTNAVHNETLALLEYLSPVQQLIFLLWAFLIGTRSSPGFLQLLRFFTRDPLIGQKWISTIRGRQEGFLSWKNSRYKET
jgi:cellulose synthase/poly-beta-1,6-N-acetylglucosamine synthase-like glycosyltransferase